MKILISNTSTRPLYEQIKDQLKDAILQGELAPGDALPSIRAFAADLKVSVLTIRRVYDDLEQEGFVTSQVGKGTFVSTGNVELLRDARRRRSRGKNGGDDRRRKNAGHQQGRAHCHDGYSLRGGLT